MCELREDCKCWDRGVKKWASAATLEIDGKLQYSFNVKFVIAQAMQSIWDLTKNIKAIDYNKREEREQEGKG
jgi:hypothetical protein